MEDKNVEIKFRANIIILKIMYEEFVSALSKSKKYKNWYVKGIGNEVLYQMLGTNRTDFSKMCNGHIKQARKKMINRTINQGSIYNAIMGERLLVFGDLDGADDWERLFADNRGLREELEEISESIRTWINNIFNNRIANGYEYECWKWMAEQVKSYVMRINNTTDHSVNEKIAGFLRLSFEELDNCDPQTINNMYKDVKKVWGYIDAIYKYKCELKKGNQRYRK